MITGKSVEEIRRLFNIKTDYSPEEEEKVGLSVWLFLYVFWEIQVRNENAWHQED